MRTKELCERAMVGRETLRFYERRGLLAAPPRIGGRRDYPEQALHRLCFIRYLKRLGFTLAEVKQAVDESCNGQIGVGRKRAALQGKLAQVKKQRAELLEIEGALLAQLAPYQRAQPSSLR